MTTATKYSLRNLALLAALASAGQIVAVRNALAQPTRDETFLAQNDQRPGPRITLAGATELVQRQTGGRVLNAQEARQDGHDGYRIKVLTRSGEVRVFFVDARSGTMQQD